jgi:hypothetical protein
MPLVLAIIRAYRLAAPAVVAADPAYAGCKSWVELSQPVGLRGATPVVPEAEFKRRVGDLVGLLPKAPAS